MTSSTVRVGIVGAGTMGRAYANALRTSDLRFRASVVAVCDRDLERAKGLAGEDAHAYADVAAMLAQESLDWVYQATPDHTHREPFAACMAAGVPCLVEKPLATTIEDAQAMVRCARAAGVTADVNFSNHANPAFLAAKQAIDSGGIGAPISVYARLSNVFSYPLGNLAWASKSSVAWFLLSHTTELASWLTNWRATTVLARGTKGRLASLGVDTWDHIQCLVGYEGGTSGIFEASWVLPESMPSMVDFEFIVHGDNGQLAVDTTHQMVTVASAESYSYPGTLGWTARRISDCLDSLEKHPSIAGMVDGLANTALLVALHRSLESGQIEQVETVEV